MKNTNSIVGSLIGAICQIESDRQLHFIVNNEIKCNIGDIVGILNNDTSIVVAIISDIELEYYLENAKLFFISKAVDNNIQQLTDPKHKPRYGQYVSATIMGHYELDTNDNLIEIKSTINRYTPCIFQGVYSIPFENSLEIYGLCLPNLKQDEFLLSKTLSLGTLSFPHIRSDKKGDYLHFRADVFKRHTLITGVTGSGKSRLAALLCKELAQIGAHVSILDPHNEYTDLLATDNKYQIHKVCQNNNDSNVKYDNNVNFRSISFYEKDINANTLAKLIPSLSPQQENKIYEVFNELNSATFNSKSFINKLIDDLNFELEANYSNRMELIHKCHIESEKYTKNHPEFIDKYIRGIKSITDNGKADKTKVLTALISKINDLRISQLFGNIEPNWLIESPHSVDVLNIDYSTNEYIRRFINSILHYLLRKKNSDSFRILIIDEAHMLLNDVTITSQLVKQLLREARKFNLSLIFVSQNMNDIPIEIRNQFQNNFSFREPDIDTTKYFQDRICHVSLFGSKTSFSLRVKDINSTIS